MKTCSEKALEWKIENEKVASKIQKKICKIKVHVFSLALNYNFRSLCLYLLLDGRNP